MRLMASIYQMTMVNNDHLAAYLAYQRAQAIIPEDREELAAGETIAIQLLSWV